MEDSMFSTLCFLALVPLSVRIFLIRKQNVRSKKQPFLFWIAQIGGVAQDLLLSAELCLILFLGTFLSSFLFLSIAAVVFVHSYLLLDILLLHSVGQRMQLGHFHYFKQFRIVKDSAAAMGLKRGVLLFALIALYDIYIGITCSSHEALLSLPLYAVSGSCGVLGIALLLYFPLYLREQSCNAMIALQMALFTRLLGKKKKESISADLPSSLIFETEECRYLSPDYPLLKETLGFKGEKLFEIAVAENEKPHIIFLFLESFRAKDVGCLGGERGVTPRFDALAEEGVLFRHFYSNGILTSHALLSSLFSVHPFLGTTHQTRLFGERRQSSDLVDYRFIGLAELLQNRGYHTAFMDSTTHSFEKQDQFLRKNAFATIVGRDDINQFSKGKQSSWGGHDEFLLRHAARWLEEEDRKGKPLFLTLFTITNHHPWHIPEGSQLRLFEEIPEGPLRQFSKTMHYTDHCLGEFIETLKKKNLLNKSIVFVLGDHGQPMGEHGNDSIQLKLYEENIHVPLLILAEGRLNAPKKIDCIGSQVDLMPTMLDLLGIKAINHGMGASLLRGAPVRKAFFHNPQVGFYLGCIEGRYKWIQSQHVQKETELYDLEADPLEEHNKAMVLPDVVERLGKSAESIFQFTTELFDSGKFAEGNCCRQEIDGREMDPEEIQEKMKRGGVRRLTLAHNLRLSSRDLALLAGSMKDLIELDMRGTMATNDVVQCVLKRTPSLERIFLSDCPLLTEQTGKLLLQKGGRLKEVHLNGIQSGSFKKKWGKVLAWQRLFLMDCPDISDRELAEIASLCPKLMALGLSCPQVTDEGIASLVRSCPDLQEIRLQDAGKLTDRSFHSLALCKLNTVQLHGVTRITPKALNFLQKPSLTVLELSDVVGFTEDAFNAIREFPLKRLHIASNQPLNDLCIRQLKHLPLQELFLSPCQYVTGAGWASIRDLPLKVLSIMDAGLSHKEEIKQALRSFSEETKIFISYT